MLRMEIFHMTRTLTSVGGRLHLVDGPARRSTTGLPSPAPSGAGRRRVTNSWFGRRTGTPLSAFLLETKVRIEIAVTYSKERIGSNSNRNYFRGSAERRGKNSCRG
jgi:hypothetical protein